MKSFYLFIQIILSAVLSVSAQTYSSVNIDSLFSGKKEIYFKFHIDSKQEIETVTQIVSIDKITTDNEVFAYANKNSFADFLETQYNYEILTHPGELIINPAMFDVNDTKEVNAWNAYPTYAAYETMMYQYATNFSSLCQIYNIKTLASGRKLLVAKISHNVASHENEPQFLYTSTMHGNETSGYVHMLHLIDTLLNGYGTNARITNILNNTELWINPLANPDGTYDASSGSSVSGSIRGNINGVDLNRNYPNPFGSQHPDGEAWQPETQAFMGFADTMNFVMSANFHEGAEVCNYPWDTKYALAADDSWWQYVSNQFADTAQAFGPSGFFTYPYSSGITNGAVWYIIDGGRQDYMNYYQHCREETIEISNDQTPSGSSLPNLWKGCKRSLLTYIEQSFKGIRGIVSDSCTGQPIRALVSISGHDADSSQVYSALPVGNYHRLIYSGTYNLTFSATGYQSRTINNISITNGNTIIKNVKLIKTIPSYPVAGYTYALNSYTLTLTNTSTFGTSYYWDFGDGNTSTSANPSHTYAADGTYTVQLIVVNGCGSDTITQQITISTVGLSDFKNNPVINIYPNPSDDLLYISVMSDNLKKIIITDITGKIVFDLPVNILKSGNVISVDINKLSEGIYILKASGSDIVYCSKIIIK